MCLLDSSSLAVRDGDLDLANEFADRAIKLIDTQQDIKKGTGEVGSIGEFVERAKLAKAHVCIMQNNLRNAINVLRCVERYSDSEKDYYSTSIFKKLEACYESVNMPDSAAYYKNKYKQIDDHFESLRNSSEYREKVKKYNAITEIQNKNQNLYTAKVVAICILSIALLIIFLQILYRYRNILFQGKDDVLTQTVQTEAKYKNSSLSQEEKSTLYNKIIQALGSDPAVFDPEFDVKRLSAIVGTHDRWVSQVINECAGKNFSALLNECRVNEACKRIADKEHYGQFTLGAIGEGVGFKNRTYFTSVFKKITGMTPSEYLDSLQ